MPLYFFNVRENEKVIEDKEGVDLSGPRAALEEATQAARDLISQSVKHG